MNAVLWFFAGAAVGGAAVLILAIFLAAYVGERMFRR